MPDDDRLKGIADQLDSEDSEESEESSNSGESRNLRESGKSDRAMADEDSPQAFGSDEMAQTTVYGSEGTIEKYKRKIRIATGRAEEAGIEEVQAREVHNAILQVGMGDIDAIVEQIRQERNE